MTYTPRRPTRSLALLSLLATLVVAPRARADHGCSDERVSLPDGPGSIGGVGDNVDVNANMGSMSTSVDIELPAGFEGATPSLALSYSSSAGSGEVGYGWSLPIPSIERMRMRGLPVYDESDEIVADGATELVRTGELEGSLVYRARFEGGFVRYRWHDREGGAAGWWTAEHPDGTIAYYGADEEGRSVRTARVQSPDGEVYRWHVVAVVDRFGHAIRFSYAKDGEHSLIDEIAYAHDARGQALYSVRFGYESRPDPITTGEPGFLLALRRRLSEIRVLAGAETIRRYLLIYEDEATSGGASRLARIEQRGRGGATHPVVFRFEYSRSLDGSCSGSCERPYVVDMGMLPAGVDIRSGRATLIDMNGDALPDIVSTSAEGRHTIVPSRIDPETGVPSFGPAYPSAATTASTSFVLSVPGVQVVDLDGNGFADMVDFRNGAVLCNTGTGDWGGTSCLMDGTRPELVDGEAGDSNPLHARFLDYDDDRRIDVIRTQHDLTQVFVNTGSGFEERVVEHIGAVFDESPTLQLADLNGDGLQDPVEILSATQLRYRLSLGYGRWTPWTAAELSGFGASDLELLQLEDLNGDGLADVVLVAGDEVRLAVNRGDRFDAAVTITSADVDGELPERVPDTTVVLFADMNGSGSRDVVWVTGSRVRFLELFPTRPNLISRVENGLGAVQQVEYGSSVLQQARDLGTEHEWARRLPYPVNVVISVDQWLRLTGTEDGGGLHDVARFRYHDGFYDGVERAFRGFALVERIEDADVEADGEEGSRVVMRFDVGATDPYRAGRLLHEARFAGAPGAWRPMRETTLTYEDCPLEGVPTSGLRLPVRYVCEVRREETLQEGLPEAEWVTTRIEREHDGWGQVVREVDLGAVHRGSPAAPIACGEECLGDEEVTERSYVEPGPRTGGAWILGKVVREVEHDGAGGPRAETITYYDGPDFVGLPEGELTRGAVTRVRQRVSEETWIDTTRVRRDAHGNVVERLTPRGSPDVLDDHRWRYTYDGDGLRMVREEALLHDASERPIALRRDVAYEPAFGLPVMETAWILVRDGAPVTASDAQSVRYDAFGRPVAIFLPGDAESAPTREIGYEPGDPISRIVMRSRTTAGGPLVAEEIQCIDGLGRQVQTRTRVGASSYQVTDFVVLNRRGRVVRRYRPHLSTSGECDTSTPDVPFVAITYDSQDRIRTITAPDESVHGTSSVTRYEYLPLATLTYDPEDADSASPHADTPTIDRFDGLGRLVERVRDLGGGRLGSTRLTYDPLGNLASVTDPLGQARVQRHDLLGRVVEVEDPSSGTTSFTLDENGDVIERRDARGRRARFERDALGRVLAHWDPDDEAGTRVELVYDLDEGCDECVHGAGRLVSATYPLGPLGMGRDEVGYDARGNQVFHARTLEGHRYVTRYEHDRLGRPVRSMLPGGVVLERAYDAAGRPTSIDGVVDDVAYGDHGEVATLFYANGARTEHTLDAAMQLRALETRVRGVVVQGASYRRDRIGNVVELRDVAERSPGRPDLGASFEYDAWYRLRRATFAARADDGDPEVLDIDVDLGDRVLRRVSSLGTASRAHVGELEYDEARAHRVVRAGARGYEYDLAGNVVARGTTELSWDHAGRLVGALAGSGAEGRFFYGPDGARVAKLEEGGATFHLGPEAEVRDGVVYVYPRLGAWRLARIRSIAIQADVLSDLAPMDGPDGEISAADAWIAHASSAGIVSARGEASDPRRLLRAAARRLLAEDGGDIAFLHHDHLGSITLATGAGGEVLGETHFYPNGEIRHRSGFTDEHGFTSQEQDESSGLLAFRHRQLDVEAGRWMSPDPGFRALTAESVAEHTVDATALYAYVGNRLVNSFDPDGLATVRQQAGAAMRAVGRGLRAVGRGLAAVGRAAGAHAARAGRALKRDVQAAVGWARRHPKRAAFNAATILLGAALTGVASGPAAGVAALAVGAGVAAASAWGSYRLSKLALSAARRAFTRLRSPEGWSARSRVQRWGRAIENVVGIGVASGLAIASLSLAVAGVAGNPLELSTKIDVAVGLGLGFAEGLAGGARGIIDVTNEDHSNAAWADHRPRPSPRLDWGRE